MIGLSIIRSKAPRPPKNNGLGNGILASTSNRRLGLISWYTTGFQ